LSLKVERDLLAALTEPLIFGNLLR